MDPRIYDDIRRRLELDYEFKLSHDRKWLRKGKCPACSRKSMYTSAEKPWVLRCERSNNCGSEYHVKELYPDAFASWSDRFKATPEAPNAAADAYLRNARGFDIERLSGWYQQENFYDGEKKAGTATVRFPIADGVWWERFIDRPERFGSQKANFRGSYGGQWWWPPSLTEIPEELWIVEGIFDNIALLHHDIAAASAMSSVNYPAKALADLAARCQAENKPRPTLVWALDGDRSGRSYAIKHAQRARDDGWTCEAAVIEFGSGGKKLDWNDMHQRGRLEPRHIDDYRYQGALLLARSATEKALLIYRHTGYNRFHFEFDHRLFWFKLDLDAYAKEAQQLEKDDTLSKEEKRDEAVKKSFTVVEIANCYPTALYFQSNSVTDESWYYFRVDFPHDGRPVNSTFTGGQLSSPSEFKKRLLSIAPGAVYTGTAGQLDHMLKKWLERVKTVETVDYIGYSLAHGAWVFNDVAIRDGKVIAINDEDYFDIGRLAIKSLSRLDLKINTDLKEFSTAWIDLLWQCYAHKGIAVLAFWLGALYAEQIRDKHKEFPFLEIVGEANSGKSTLIEFLWKLCGRQSYEGFDPAQSTIAARARNFSQVSNLPVVLMEGDRPKEDKIKQRGFDWEELKPLFNGRSVYSRGVKNSGNETYEPPFRGALVIAQNDPVSAHEAVMQRICHIDFDTSSHTDAGAAAGEILKGMEVEALSGFLVKACAAEKVVLETFESALPKHLARIGALKGLRNSRIVRNHAKLAALIDALAKVIPIERLVLEQTQAFVEDMAVERQEAINTDHPLVQEFWEIYEFLNGEEFLNHSVTPDTNIAINLPHFVSLAADRRQQIPDMREIKKLLKTSRARKFLGSGTTRSRLNEQYNLRRDKDAKARPETCKCWSFSQLPK